MGKFRYDNIPTFVGGGESSGGKTHTAAKLVESEFQSGMEVMTGDGMTTPWQMETIIDPEISKACIELETLNEDEIREKFIKNLQPSLVSECKNVIASMPENSPVEQEKFINIAVEKRSELSDKTFKVHKLLLQEKEAYYQLLTGIFTKAIERAAEPSFRRNYRECANESKTDATAMVEMLINNVLDEELCEHNIDSIVHLIESETKRILETNGFQAGVLEDINAETFNSVMKVLTNSSRKEFEDIPSTACGIRSLCVIVPGKGITVEEYQSLAYKIIDVVGFNNDGLKNIDERLRQAMLTKYNYDGILYFASKKVINKMHESYLDLIFKTMRPAKLILVSTFMDTDSIFDEDDYPDESDIIKLNEERKVELRKLVDCIASKDSHVILPTLNDIICISNKVSKKRNGEAALKIYNENQYDDLRVAMGRAIRSVRKKICIGVTCNSNYLKPERPIEQHIGETINLLGNIVDSELSKIRDLSDKIHHWTLDAILWNFINGRQHVSDAKVWMNVTITTFSSMEELFRDELGKFTFSADTKISSKEDAERIKNEFEANLCTQLYYVARKLVLVDSEDGTKESEYKKEIRRLARESKYNKWKIVDDFRLCMMNAVVQRDYIFRMIQDAVNVALVQTYQKMLY